MANRSWHDLMAMRTCEYRFYENSLRNYATVLQYDAGQDLGTSNAGIIYEGVLDDHRALGTPRQSRELDLPCIMLDADDQHFDLPPPLLVDDEAAFTCEYIGVPRRAMNQYDDLGIALGNRITLISDESGAQPCYVTLLCDQSGTGANLVDIGMGALGGAVSDAGTWWRSDHPLHLVVSRNAGPAGVTSVFLNGVAVFFNGGAVSAPVGVLGFTADGILFNRIRAQQTSEPFCGGHFMVRMFSDVVSGDEVNHLYQRARKLFPNLMFPIPVMEHAPA